MGTRERSDAEIEQALRTAQKTPEWYRACALVVEAFAGKSDLEIAALNSAEVLAGVQACREAIAELDAPAREG